MKANTLISLSVQQLKRALELRERIETLEGELSSILGETPVAAAAPSPAAATAAPAVKGKRGRKGKRLMSAEWRAKIAAAQTRRWAKARAEKAVKLSPAKPIFESFVKKAAPGKRVMSAETKAKIAATMRAKQLGKARAAGKY